jgi:hypothetical protein
VDAILWMLTSGIAMAFILNGKVQQGRYWMTRSFAVAIVFLEVRFVAGFHRLRSTSDALTHQGVERRAMSNPLHATG